MITTETLENRFTYHSPKSENVKKFQKIRTTAFDLAIVINHLCPDCREMSLAITKLEEAVFWANAAIARNQEKDKDKED